MKVYLINLDRSKDRFQNMKRLLAQMDIPFERIPAVDASRELTHSHFNIVTAPNIIYPHPLAPGEVACFLSHKKCWKKLIDSGDDWALILEDNCEFSNKACLYLKSTSWIPKECRIVQFALSEKTVFTNKQIKLSDSNSLIRLMCSSPIGTSAYFISRDAALLAMELSTVIAEPVDSFLFGMFSNFPKQVSSWRLQNAVIKRADVNTTIAGRNRKKKNFEMIGLHPIRLYLKIKIRLQRLFLNKIKQQWLSEQ